MGFVAQMRDWLQRNKVFFEVAAAILIGGASLVVSWSALRVSEKTLAAAEVGALPHFALSKRPRLDPITGKFIEETLVLNNYGAPVSNVTWTVRTFFVFERYKPSPARNYVPVVGYYVAQSRTASPTGELASTLGHENLRKIGLLHSDAVNRKVVDADFSVFPTLLTISAVTYEDRLGRVAKEYFRDYTKVSEGDAKPLLDLAGRVNGIDIDNVTLSEALSAAKIGEVMSTPGHK